MPLSPRYRWAVGDPLTTTGSEKRTAHTITSPARNAPPAPEPVPSGVTETTVGPTPSAAPPFTVKPPSFATAWLPRPSAAALPAPSRIVPPFSESAEAPTEIPSESASPLTTV